MPLSSDKKKQIIKQLKEHTDIAEYAFKNALKNQALSEDQLWFLVENIEIISVLKPVISANRQGQKKSSEKNNKKFRDEAKSAKIKVKELEDENTTLKQKIDNLLTELFDIENSELYQLGKWLKNALSKTGTERDKDLIDKELVHKEFYNNTVTIAKAEFERRDNEDREIESEYLHTVQNLEARIDYLRKIADKSEKFVKDNHGNDTWNNLIK